MACRPARRRPRARRTRRWPSCARRARSRGLRRGPSSSPVMTTCLPRRRTSRCSRRASGPRAWWFRPRSSSSARSPNRVTARSAASSTRQSPSIGISRVEPFVRALCHETPRRDRRARWRRSGCRLRNAYPRHRDRASPRRRPCRSCPLRSMVRPCRAVVVRHEEPPRGRSRRRGPRGRRARIRRLPRRDDRRAEVSADPPDDFVTPAASTPKSTASGSPISRCAPSSRSSLDFRQRDHTAPDRATCSRPCARTPPCLAEVHAES